MPTPRPPLALELLEYLEDGVILIAGERVYYLNPAAATFLGVDPATMTGLPLIGVLRDHRLESAYLAGVSIEVEMRGRILQARGVAGGLILRELTEVRRAQENARELLAVLSHELRTPVTTIRSTLEALHYEMPEAQRARFLGRAESEAERLTRLLEDLTVDVKPPRARSISLNDIVTRAVTLLQDTFNEHNVRVDTQVPPLTVYADTDKLLQVLINLLENAAVHGPDGKTVCLCAHPDPQNAQLLLIRVQDEGEPLAPDTIEALFEPHARGRGVKAKGTGLGLYIVRSIAGRWGGHAWGKALAGGNEFGFAIPLRPKP